MIAYNPLAGGFLSGKYDTPEPPRPGPGSPWGESGPLYRDRYWQAAPVRRGPGVEGYFDARGLTSPPSRSPGCWPVRASPRAIVGASRPEQLDATLAAADLPLDAEAREACDAAWWSLPRRDEPR